MRPRIIVTDKLDEEAVKELQGFADVAVKLDLNEDGIAKEIADYDCIIVRGKTKVTGRIIRAGKLKCIVRAGVGTDNIDKEAAREKGVEVLNTPGAATQSVAELTIALALNVLRRVNRADGLIRKEKWEKIEGNELYGKTWGIVGFGRIGQRVAKILNAFDCKVIAYDPQFNEKMARELKVGRAQLDDLYRGADIISLHVPLMPATERMLNEAKLSMCKPNAVIVNTARSKLVDAVAVAKALKSGRIFGYAEDVFESDFPVDKGLAGQDNTVFACHMGAQTVEAQQKVGSEVVKVVREFFKIK